MQLSFDGQPLRQSIMEPTLSKWPSPQALNDVQTLVADLIAASSLLEVPLGVPNLNHASPGGFELTAGDSIVLQCKVDHVPLRKRSDDSPAWDQIDRIKIMGWKEANG